MNEVIIQRENLETIRQDGAWLFPLHWQEVANYRDIVPLNILWEMFEALEKDGKFVGITARIDGKIVGYSCFVAGGHLHYKSLKVAANDVIFVHQEYRKTGLGKRLIAESETILKSLGFNKIKWHMKPNKSFAPLLARLGYLHEEETWGKLL